MASTPFDERLARLSRRERTAFVGALLAARGWDVEVDSPVVRARTGDRRQVVAVAREGVVPLPGRGLPRTPVDVVVGIGADRTERLAAERDADAWDARVLYDMARHGLDPATTDRLFDEHLGVTSEAVGRPTTPDAAGVAPDAGTARDPSAADARPRPDVDGSASTTDDAPTGRLGQWGVPLVVLLLVAVLFGGAFAAQALTGVSPTDAGDGGTDTMSAPGDDARSPRTPASTPEPRTLLPGLTDAGIEDTAILARGHATALADRSFTMRIIYTERVDGEIVGMAQEVVRVESGTVYRSRGTESGDIAADLVPVIVRDLYADGEGRYLQQGDDAVRVGDADDPGTGQVVERSRALVAWYLSGDRSAVAGEIQRRDSAYYRVTVEGTTDRRFSEYRAIGLVSDRGLVVRVEATYRLPESDRVATVSLRHVDVGATTVDRPAWMPPANESAG